MEFWDSAFALASAAYRVCKARWQAGGHDGTHDLRETMALKAYLEWYIKAVSAFAEDRQREFRLEIKS